MCDACAPAETAAEAEAALPSTALTCRTLQIMPRSRLPRGPPSMSDFDASPQPQEHNDESRLGRNDVELGSNSDSGSGSAGRNVAQTKSKTR